MKPRADFACLGPKCKTDAGESPVFEAPVDAKFCPSCGSKRISRLFNKVAVFRGAAPPPDPRLTSSSHARRMDVPLRSIYDDRDARRPPTGMESRPLADFERTTAARVPLMGPSGKGRPMKHAEIAAVMQQDLRQFKAPVSPSSVMTLMGKSPIPTTPLKSRDE